MNYRFADKMNSFKSSAVREILKLTQGDAIISLAGGLPAEEHFPLEAVRDAFNRVLDQGKHVLQYGLTEGYTPLRESLCNHLARKHMHVTPDNMLLTTGSQQAIDLLTRVYINPGDVILVERPTYLAAIQVFQSNGARVISVEGDDEGMNLDDLSHKIKQYQAKMAYVIPTFSNPGGKAWSLERRKGFLEICKNNQVLIIEDDPYGELKFGEDTHYPTLFSLDDHPQGSSVVYTSTFSKIVAPALRTGWAIGDREVISSMTRAKQAADLHSSTMDQQALHQLFEHFDLYGHIATVRHEYEKRKNHMLSLMKQQQWENVSWLEPKGGMFVWVKLPEGTKAEDLLQYAVKEGVAFVPGSSFFASDPMYNTMRMNFSYSAHDQMVLAIERLNAAMEKYKADFSTAAR
ncbi:PLP-dependent aminotransferase family protein [Paenibacillus thalictri]|uniref:PLP-dependent aminotransferase family protein n=1 Tax=Paenibacillus thalictri TaxID=2527873 RepID=A0A4Q9DG84_9BACL|nr:PLP-dependent aminotransferase family protein [Paenibacillus thalictri]TBL69291.1 PLP-dependent aminotransferase family protein [Paenibacillus thalictri]